MRKRGTRIWSMVLVLAMLLTVMPVSALARDDTNSMYKSRSEVTGFLENIEEADANAITITTANELASITGGNYVLGCDIDLSTYNNGIWVPVELSEELTFDGQGHTISNLTNYLFESNGDGSYYSTTIKNLGIIDVNNGGIIDSWHNYGDGALNLTIKNCFISGISEGGFLVDSISNISYSRWYDAYKADSIVSISDCYVKGNVVGGYNKYGGGFIRDCYSGFSSSTDRLDVESTLDIEIVDSISYANIATELPQCSGGFIGQLDSSLSLGTVYARFRNCAFWGTIRNVHPIEVNNFVGCQYNRTRVTFENCSVADNNNPSDTDTETDANSMVALFTSYDEGTKQAIFGSDPTPYTYQITDETVLSEEITSLIGKTVLVRYKSGEYGAPDMLTHYVLSISPASVASGTLKNVTQNIISIGNKEYPLDIQNGSASLDTLQNNLGNFAVCYFYNDAVVDVKFPKKQTGIFNTGTQSSITIDNKKYLAAFANPAPYLSAIDLWFNQTVEYWIVDDIIYDIQLLDYETTIYKRLEKIQDNKAYFHDGSNYQIVDSSSIDDSLVGHWVVATLTTSADGGTMLSDMRLFQPQISVEIEMVDDRNVRLKDNEYSYDGSDYVPSSKFEIGYEITIKSKVPGISDIDLVAMREDPSMTVTLENLEITPPDGFNSGWTGSGEIPDVPGTTVLPGQTKVGKGFVRPGMWYFVDKEDVSVTETIRMKLETSTGEYEDEVSFTIMNLNYEPPKTKEEALNSSETKSLIDEAADELDELDIDSGIMITDPSLVKLDFGIDDNSLTRLKKELLTEVLMSSAPEDSLSDQIADDLMSKVFGEYKSPVSGSKYTVPLRYVFETPDYGMLTVQFTCNINSFTLNSSKYALYATVDYEVLQQDKDSGDKTWPAYKKGDFAQIAFADVKAYTDAAYDVAKEAIKDAYDDVWGKQANQIADFLFDDVVKAILKASKTSFSDAMWKIMTWPTENMSVACPVDIFIYDANGNLCGSIENNQVTKTSAEFGLSVSGDVKYVTGLRDDYKVLYKATDNGSMDIAITEYTGYESPLRAVTFKAVPLAQDGTYTQNIAGEVLAEVNSYKLISNTEEGDIIPDDKVILIGWTSDENDQEETPTPPSEPGGNSGGSGGSSSSTNRYAISVVDGIDNGFISVNPSQAEPGDIVTITIDPDAGYELDSLIVTDSSGNQIAIEKETDTRYTFKMPRGRISIDATFIAIEDESASQTSGEPFADVSSRDWFYDAVEYVYENGMMQGTSSSLFEPNGVTTRAMVVTILHRCAGETRTYKSDFTDVASNMYYADAVAWAQANGIVNGTSATTFSPNDPITREQMATILYRYADFKDYDMTIGGMWLHKYTDADQISAFANDAMRWANENELITGDTTMSLNPQDNATRAEVAMILMRFCKSIV